MAECWPEKSQKLSGLGCTVCALPAISRLLDSSRGRSKGNQRVINANVNGRAIRIRYRDLIHPLGRIRPRSDPTCEINMQL